MSGNYHTLRKPVYEKFKEWNCYNIDAFHLEFLCGRKRAFESDTECSAKEEEICRQLLGPYGYAMHKILYDKRIREENGKNRWEES